ncbi:YIP1 family protein [Psychrobacillus sp. OK032]|uniref:YIP1 family protein n=1 Tax=Psychrobacillus sp. OK032 TaxID=1884358 RepID=UPI0008BD1B14|nr:YIP1 family protein [Psychrobacillus sp. OK032]SES26443.1 Yip1 domain-containing protein [Psychrobacillus sp. OK032]
MKKEEIEILNPFFSIWLSTRETIRYVLDYKDLRYSLTIAAVASIPNTIGVIGEWEKSYDIPFWLMLIGIFVLGPIFGLIGLVIGAAIYTLVGKWFGGTGKFKEMLQAGGVNMIPIIWMTPYYIVAAIIARNGFADITIWPVPAGVIGWLLLSFFIMSAFSIWMVIIQSKAIGEVHQFSSWRGFSTLIIPAITIGIIVFIITFIVIFSVSTGEY